jgi:DNA-binding transcriptional LysR family regulator
MRLTLSQIEAFHRIAQLGSFHAAARSMALSQPALSVRMRALEEVVGQRLFERQGKRTELTAAGLALLQHAESMLAIATKVSRKTFAFDPLAVGLRLGAPESFAMVCVPMMLEFIEHEYPDLHLALTIENSTVLNHLMADGKLDVAFISEAQVGVKYHAEFLGRQDVAWVASRRIQSPRRVARPSDFICEHVFTNAEPSRLFSLVREWFAKDNLKPTRISTCNNLSVVAQLTARSPGISILPTTIVRQELRSGVLRRLNTSPKVEPQRIYAVYRSGQTGRSIELVLKAARYVMKRTRFLCD